ncbi:hypothetical protein FHR83_003443 [Actinoplanes campanulatus]|uniref:Uncharacterized protein n=1 Tax=Actinoplanes campanulatus TaxID=113559 RepID=A0A7W5AGB9_9ACTN|nr:hypothetical protein [Actinoplanes campanulatus]MBB3095773.1 hypothetical protein [Actinoplanes campanulatus]GGN11442.1 hypothetical protein GCM10010109_21560 [Actinoplanes campanulatus]GID36672.1 hypothetical protein Aca09nite_31780 [Actinoplanes campanulatus]
MTGADNASGLTVFALHRSGRRDTVAAALNRSDRAALAALLKPAEIFVDMAVVRESGARRPESSQRQGADETRQVDQLAGHCSRAFRRYLNLVGQFHTLGDFHAAIHGLLAPPPASCPSEAGGPKSSA